MHTHERERERIKRIKRIKRALTSFSLCSLV